VRRSIYANDATHLDSLHLLIKRIKDGDEGVPLSRDIPEDTKARGVGLVGEGGGVLVGVEGGHEDGSRGFRGQLDRGHEVWFFLCTVRCEREGIAEGIREC
jgi:hypothetical protein